MEVAGCFVDSAPNGVPYVASSSLTFAMTFGWRVRLLREAVANSVGRGTGSGRAYAQGEDEELVEYYRCARRGRLRQNCGNGQGE